MVMLKYAPDGRWRTAESRIKNTMSSLRYAIRTAQTPSRRAVQESAKRFTTRGGRSVTAAPTSACEVARKHGDCTVCVLCLSMRAPESWRRRARNGREPNLWVRGPPSDAPARAPCTKRERGGREATRWTRVAACYRFQRRKKCAALHCAILSVPYTGCFEIWPSSRHGIVNCDPGTMLAKASLAASKGFIKRGRRKQLSLVRPRPRIRIWLTSHWLAANGGSTTAKEAPPPFFLLFWWRKRDAQLALRPARGAEWPLARREETTPLPG